MDTPPLEDASTGIEGPLQVIRLARLRISAPAMDSSWAISRICLSALDVDSRLLRDVTHLLLLLSAPRRLCGVFGLRIHEMTEAIIGMRVNRRDAEAQRVSEFCVESPDYATGRFNAWRRS